MNSIYYANQEAISSKILTCLFLGLPSGWNAWGNHADIWKGNQRPAVTGRAGAVLHWFRGLFYYVLSLSPLSFSFPVLFCPTEFHITLFFKIKVFWLKFFNWAQRGPVHIYTFTGTYIHRGTGENNKEIKNKWIKMVKPGELLLVNWSLAYIDWTGGFQTR